MRDRIRLLFVGDDRDSLVNRGEILAEEDGFDVLTAESVSNAASILEECPVDCVLCKFKTLGEDRSDFLEYVSVNYPTVPFIFITADESNEVDQEVFPAGALGFISTSLPNISYDLVAERISQAAAQASSSNVVESMDANNLGELSPGDDGSAVDQAIAPLDGEEDIADPWMASDGVGAAIETIFDNLECTTSRTGRTYNGIELIDSENESGHYSAIPSTRISVDRPIAATMNARFLRRINGNGPRFESDDEAGSGDATNTIREHDTTSGADAALVSTVLELLTGISGDAPDLVRVTRAIGMRGSTALDVPGSSEEMAAELLALIDADDPESIPHEKASDDIDPGSAILAAVAEATKDVSREGKSGRMLSGTNEPVQVEADAQLSSAGGGGNFTVEELLARTSHYADDVNIDPSTDPAADRPDNEKDDSSTDPAANRPDNESDPARSEDAVGVRSSRYATESRFATETGNAEREPPITSKERTLEDEITDAMAAVGQISGRNRTEGADISVDEYRDRRTDRGIYSSDPQPDHRTAETHDVVGGTDNDAVYPVTTSIKKDTDEETGSPKIKSGSTSLSVDNPTPKPNTESTPEAINARSPPENRGVINRHQSDQSVAGTSPEDPNVDGSSNDEQLPSADPESSSTSDQPSETSQAEAFNESSPIMAGLADLPKEELVRLLERLTRDKDTVDEPDTNGESVATNEVTGADERESATNEATTATAEDVPEVTESDESDDTDEEELVSSSDQNIVFDTNKESTDDDSTWDLAGEYHRPDDLSMAAGTSVLVTCNSQDDRKHTACTDLLCLDLPDVEQGMLVQYRSLKPDRIRQVAERVSDLRIIAIGCQQPIPSGYEDDVHVLSINNPNDLTRLGIVITGILDGWADASGERTFCFDSLDVPLQYQSVKSLFRFLHILLGKLQEADTVAHFHVDPTADGHQEINVLKPLFDDVVSIDAGGVQLE